jgi:hypothetical protein
MAVITCTHCGATGNAPDQILGQQVRCSKCKQSFMAGGSPPSPLSSIVDDVQEEPDYADEGFPTGEDIAKPRVRRGARRDDDDDDDSPRHRIRKRGSSGLTDLLMFRRMVAPYLIMIVFWIGTVATIIGALALMGFGVASGETQGLIVGLVGGFLGLFLGPLIVRLWCEVMIVVFRINETLTDIRNEIHKGE